MTPIEIEALKSMFLNPRVPMVTINLDSIPDEGTRTAVRNLLRTIELVYGGVARASNHNLAKMVSQPSRPDVLEGESVVWLDSDAPIGEPYVFIVANIGGRVVTFQALEVAPNQPPPPPPPTPLTPTVTSVSPGVGSVDGGTSIQLTGTNFEAGALVSVGGIAATSVTVIGSTSISAITPAHAAGTVNIVVTNPSGLSGTLAAGFTYQVAAPTGADFLDSFETSITEGGRYFLQAADPSRATLVPTARHLSSAVQLQTSGNDFNVNGSGTWERCDLNLGQARSDGYEGREHWWAHSLYLPTDFQTPTSGATEYLIWQWHHTGSTGVPNLKISAFYNGGTPRLKIRGYGGSIVGGGLYESFIHAGVPKNVWLDLLWHIKWTSTAAGLCEAWMREGAGANYVRVMTPHNGATLYSGQGMYLKPSNYHASNGVASSVIHDRIARGPSAASVAIPGVTIDP